LAVLQELDQRSRVASAYSDDKFFPSSFHFQKWVWIVGRASANVAGKKLIVRKCSSVLIKAAINGPRTKRDHSCVPITPEEQMREARAAVEAGAGAIHVHVRDTAGRESLAPDDVARCLNAIRDGNPGTSVGISTGAWIVPNANERLSLVEMWGTIPDFASVNVHEEGAIELMRTLLDKGVGIEAGVWNKSAARLLIKSGEVKNCLRILIEPAEA